MAEFSIHCCDVDYDLKKKTTHLLLQHGAQINRERDSDGWTLLHWTCYIGWVDQVRLILEQGVADLNAAAKDGKTPLILAARSGHREIFDLLIQFGAQVNWVRDSDGETILHWACFNGWVDQVRLILEKGIADLNAAAKNGKTPLILAARSGHRGIFDLLIQHGAKVNCEIDCHGGTLLHWACFYGWVDQVRLIVEKGVADLNVTSTDGLTPLILAVIRRHVEIVDLLIQYGAQVNYEIGCDGVTSLHSACCKGWKDQLMLILEQGVEDLYATVTDGITPLFLAARRGHREIVDLLIRYGAQVNCGCDREGWTLLHWACCKGWLDQVRIILEKGAADLNAAANDGDTPLKVALEYGNREIFILLFQYGAIMDVNNDLISQHSFLEVFKDVNLCIQSIRNNLQFQSLPTFYRNPDIAKKLPIFKNFQLKDQQTQEIAKFVESEIKTKKFCNVFNSKPIVLMVLCVQSLISYHSARRMSTSSDSNLPFKKTRFN